MFFLVSIPVCAAGSNVTMQVCVFNSLHVAGRDRERREIETEVEQ